MNDAVPIDFEVLAGAGNCFAMVELREASPTPALFEGARELCDREQLDGVVFVGPGSGRAQLRMIVINADGSRPEACGNGLRCAAVFGVRRGLARGPCFRIATDSGHREVELLPDDSVRVELGRATATAFNVELAGSRRTAFEVCVGNPHGVLFADPDEPVTLADAVAALRPLERFAGGVNVELARPIEPGLYRVEVDERGVGPTAACGTGACAVAVAAWLPGPDAPGPDEPGAELRLQFTGGELRVSRKASGELLLRGTVEHLKPATFPAHSCRGSR